MSRVSERPVEAFPVRHVASIPPKPKEAQWLVDKLWAASGVGVLGGLPKTLKTWLATELALAVSTGTKALGCFAAMTPGPVLFFAAEDDPPAMRTRFDAVATARGIRLQDAPVLLLDLAELRLDHPAHIVRLGRTVASTRARLLILDPFVRVARIDENSSQEVSAVLGALRTIQRDHDVAVLLVHHMRKSPSPHPGQQLRGSSDFAAWLDSGLYLLRNGSNLLLCAEHRAAPAPPPVSLRLALDPAPHLVVIEQRIPSNQSPADPLQAALLELLRRSKRPVPTLALRDALKVRKATLLDTLHSLRNAGQLVRYQDGWSLTAQETP